MSRRGKITWPRRGRIVDGAFVEDNENGELITGKQFRDAAHKKPSVYYFGAEFEDFALDKLERFSANESNGMERHAASRSRPTLFSTGSRRTNRSGSTSGCSLRSSARD